MALIKKILEEVGLSSILKVPFVLTDVFEKSDVETPELISLEGKSLELPYGTIEDEGKVNHYFGRLESDQKWRGMSKYLAVLSMYDWDEEDYDLEELLAPLKSADHQYFSYYNQTLERSDFWEWYLTPWHRTYGRFAVAYFDERLRPHLESVWEHYDEMFREEKPWMRWVPTGSNIAGVTAGHALHALIGIIKTDDEYYYDRYNQYLHQFHIQLNRAYDTSGTIPSPMEGITYGNFIWSTAVFLGIFQEKLGIWSLLDLDWVRKYPKYVTMSMTPEGEFQASGDSRTVMNYMPTRSIFSALYFIHDDEDAKEIIDNYSHDPVVYGMFQ